MDLGYLPTHLSRRKLLPVPLVPLRHPVFLQQHRLGQSPILDVGADAPQILIIIPGSLRVRLPEPLGKLLKVQQVLETRRIRKRLLVAVARRRGRAVARARVRIRRGGRAAALPV
jgi:hypothetical protein